MNHVHVQAHPHVVLDSGSHFEVCECGATRKLDKAGRAELSPIGGRYNARNDSEGWHTCMLCTPEVHK
jgi:hypothetical protein